MPSKRKVVVVTGASAGVGRATAREFARRGYDVALISRNEARLRAAQREIEAFGRKAVVQALDVSDAEALEAAADEIESALGPIDVWVNNAMVSVFSPVKELQAAEVERVTQVTYLGAVYGTMAALRRMLRRDSGVIVQVGSALAYRSIPLQAAYCGAKHALAGFTDSLRCELIHDQSRIHITQVNLPALNTPQFSWVRSRLPRRPQPVPPIYQPEVAARAIVWAAQHRRRQLHVGLPTVLAVEGNKLAPGLADRYLGRTGFDAQQTRQPAERERPDNLYQSVEGDYAAHGAFDGRARSYSLESLVARHPLALMGVALAAATAVSGLGTLGALWAGRRFARAAGQGLQKLSSARRAA